MLEWLLQTDGDRASPNCLLLPPHHLQHQQHQQHPLHQQHWWCGSQRLHQGLHPDAPHPLRVAAPMVAAFEVYWPSPPLLWLLAMQRVRLYQELRLLEGWDPSELTLPG